MLYGSEGEIVYGPPPVKLKSTTSTVGSASPAVQSPLVESMFPLAFVIASRKVQLPSPAVVVSSVELTVIVAADAVWVTAKKTINATESASRNIVFMH